MLSLGQACLDLALRGSPLGDDLLLSRAGLLQLLATDRHLGTEPLDLLQDLRVLLGDAVDRVQAVDEILEARAAEEHLGAWSPT